MEKPIPICPIACARDSAGRRAEVRTGGPCPSNCPGCPFTVWLGDLALQAAAVREYAVPRGKPVPLEC
jgi:hypothetical protein